MRKPISQCLAVTSLSLISALAFSNCSTMNDAGSRKVASADNQSDFGAGDHGGPGPINHPPAPINRGPGPGPGYHGGPGGPGGGFAPVRVNNPVFFHGGGPRLWQQRGWQHWNHPGYIDPIYQFDWTHIVSMTCTAEDANGVQYPVSEDGFTGPQWQASVTSIEDDALDTCYNESPVQGSCFLAGCTPTYPPGYVPSF